MSLQKLLLRMGPQRIPAPTKLFLGQTTMLRALSLHFKSHSVPLYHPRFLAQVKDQTLSVQRAIRMDLHQTIVPKRNAHGLARLVQVISLHHHYCFRQHHHQRPLRVVMCLVALSQTPTRQMILHRLLGHFSISGARNPSQIKWNEITGVSKN